MTTKELAQKLNGISYPVRIPKEINDAAKAAGLVIVYGASDDLMEFDGAIREEVGVNDGGTAFLDEKGLVENACHGEDDCPYFQRVKESATRIHALWCKEGGYSWTYKTEIPHETFVVLDGDAGPYCRGIVFRLADVMPPAPAAAVSPEPVTFKLKTGDIVTREEIIESLREGAHAITEKQKKRDPGFVRYPTLEALMDYIEDNGIPARAGGKGA